MLMALYKFTYYHFNYYIIIITVAITVTIIIIIIIIILLKQVTTICWQQRSGLNVKIFCGDLLL